MRSKDSCPVWGEGAGKMPNWQLADALLYRTYGSVRGALSNGRSYRDDETGRLATLTGYPWITQAINQVSR